MKKLMVIAVLFVFMTGSAYAAAEWNFYGSARVSTFYSSFDNDPFAPGTDTENFEMDLNGNARIGAKVKVSDDLTAQFEYGAKKDKANIRLLWGEWNFGKGSLGIGQHYTPLLFPYSNQVYNIHGKEEGDTNMSLFGMLYGGRKPMIRLKFGNFQIAVVEPRERVYCVPTYNGNATGLAAATAPGATYTRPDGTQITVIDLATGAAAGAAYVADNSDLLAAGPSTETKIPSIQAKYKFDFNMGHVALAAGYQSFDVMDGGKDYTVESYLAGIGGRLNVGKAYFKGNFWGGQNTGNMADVLTNGNLVSTWANYSSGDTNGSGMGYARWSDGKLNGVAGAAYPEKGITDVDVYAGLIVAGYEVRKGLYFEAGYGYTCTEFDEPGSTKDDAETFYLQSTIFLAPGVFLTPEIGMLDAKQDGESELFYAGVKWQINF